MGATMTNGWVGRPVTPVKCQHGVVKLNQEIQQEKSHHGLTEINLPGDVLEV